MVGHWGRAALLLVAALAAAPGAARAQNAPTGEITFAGYVGIFQDNYTAAVIEPFLKRFPGIKVSYFPMQTSAQMLGLLRAHKDDPEVDAVILDISVSGAGNQEGLFVPLDPALVPNAADIHDLGKVAGGFGPAVTFDHFVMLYNTELVTPPPTGFADFWNPAYKGQVALVAAPNIQAIALTILIDNALGADYRKTIDPAVKRLAALSPNVQTWEAKPDNYTVVANGTAKLGTGWNARAQLYGDLTKGKLGVLIPSEGSAFQINTMNLVAKGKHLAAAQAFINYTLSPEAQAAFTERMFYAPTNKKAAVSPDALARTATAPAAMAKMLPIDWDYVLTVRDAWLNRWRREIIVAR
ncbi:MAG: extracellular solute-binding protein [Proteobacteria bacterium]|nr:extracellular solute-binding protein [Pseudomonadota bacterium]